METDCEILRRVYSMLLLGRFYILHSQRAVKIMIKVVPSFFFGSSFAILPGQVRRIQFISKVKLRNLNIVLTYEFSVNREALT